MRVFIYGLVDPISKKLRYVGQTRRGFKRIREHWRASVLSKEARTHKTRWIKSLVVKGLTPSVVVFQEFEDDSWLNEAEVLWLRYLKSCGHPLTNLTEGGGGIVGWHHSESTKKKISNAHMGTKKPWVGRSLVGIPKSAEHAAKCRVAAPRTAILDQNGVRYNGIREAARILGLNRDCIKAILRGRMKQTKGYTFRRA
jgi:hypothetical protein